MAGRVTKDGVWACWADGEWFWVFGEPETKVPGVNYTQMDAVYDRDSYVCYVDGHKLEVSGLEVQTAPAIAYRMKSYIKSPEDKAFVGFDNLPEPEFGTGWDDFDWSV